MKIAINLKYINSPWGGGNRFIKSFSEYFKKLGHEIIYNLKDRDIDIILILDPRINHPQSNFSIYSILKYIKNTKSDTIIVHRINECDERKNTKKINNILRFSNFFSDHTVLVGSWMKKLNIIHKNNFEKISTILNGADDKLFEFKKKEIINKTVNLVTHHWSNNYMKGFDIYNFIDKEILTSNQMKHKINFTYIGNMPKDFKFVNSKTIDPLDGKDLVNELNKHNIYVTASINEPGGNHQNEAALCGLPVLYRESGCLPEYCNGYGVMFNYENFEQKLYELINNHSFYAEALSKYPNTANKMNSEYHKLFNKLIIEKNSILKNRKFNHKNFENYLNLSSYYISLI